MNPTGENTVNIRVKFADRALARPVLQNLRLGGRLAVSILRGRITKTEAALDLELRGSQGRIERFLQQSAAQGAVISPCPAGMA